MKGMAACPVFIGGLMKSGTSLLRTLLGQHSDLFASFETHWFDDAVRDHWDDPTSRRMQYLLEFYEIGGPTYTRLCDEKRAAPGREFIDILLDHCTRRAGKRRWAEKTPGNIHHYHLIRRTWPDARFVHVTREYRDCFASWKDKRKDSIEDFLASAKTAYGDVDGLLGQRSAEYLEVDYVELVTRTEETMRRVLDFAGLDWQTACASLDLTTTARERERVKQVIGRDSHTNISLSKPIFGDSIGQWRRILTAEEAARIEAELAPFYAVLGDRWAHL